MARPRKEWDIVQFEKLCALQATKEEIAGWFDFSEDTLERRVNEEYGESFAVVFAKKKGDGKISLRRKQWKLADTNASMAIFLGKNHLGQKDSHEITSDKPIKLQYSLDDEPDTKADS